MSVEGKGAVARKRAALLHVLADRARAPAIVYCGTRKDTDARRGELADEGLAAVAYHAGMSPEAARGQPGCVHGGARRGRRGDERVRHGRRQGRRAHGGALGVADEPGGLLPGGRSRRPRRASRRGRCCLARGWT